MRLRKKIIIAFCVAALLFLTSLCGIILYLYTHPSDIKSFIEKSISRSTGTEFSIKTLSYSIKPLRIQAQGIVLNPGRGLDGFDLKIHDLRADIALEGPFGQKTLTFRSFKVNGLSLHFSEEMTLPEITAGTKSTSFLKRILQGAIAYFLFRDIKFQEIELEGGDISARLKDQIIKVKGIHASMNTDHLVEISCSTRIESPLKKMSLTASQLHITTESAVSFVNPEIKCVLAAQKMTFKSPEANVKNMKMKAKIFYHHHDKRLSFEPLDIRFEGVTIKEESNKNLSPLDLHLKAEGLFDLQESKLNASHFHLRVNEALQLKAELGADFGAQARIALKLLDCNLLPRKLLPLLPCRIKEGLSPITLSGPISLHGNINGLRKSETWSWQCDLKARLKQNQFSFTNEKIRLSSSLSGDIQAEGRFPDMKISVRLEGDESVLSGMGIEPEPFKTSISFTGRYPLYPINNIAIQIPSAKVPVGEKEILIEDIQVLIRNGTLDGEKRSLSLPEIRLDTSWLKNLALSLDVDGKEVVMQVRGKDVHLMESAIALNILPSGWQFAAMDSIQIEATLEEQKYLSFASRVGFRDLGFQNQDESCIGEKISLVTEMNGKVHLKDSYIVADTSLEIDGGEILYDRFYLDLNQNAFSSSFEGRYDISKKALQISRLGLGLKDVITLVIRGGILQKERDHHVHLSVNIPETPLKPIFHHFIFEPFKAEKPFLATLNMDGTIFANLELTGKGAEWISRGRLIWHEGEFSTDDNGFSCHGIDLDLPIWYHSPVKDDKIKSAINEQESSPKEQAIKGKLSIKTICIPLLPKQPVNLTLEAEANRLSISSPTIIRIPGGNIRVGPIICEDIFFSGRSINTSLTLDSVKANTLLSQIWPDPVKGRIDGRLLPINFKENRLSSSGEIKASLFGGEIILFDIGASGMFTSAPVFRLSARLDDLLLADLTENTSFGKIEGILTGYIKGMEIAYGQPQRFDMLLETVEKKGVPQKISVKAIDNIARIGGGGSPFIGLAGIFTSFFKEFPYKKIGVHAFLENDVFRINGTVKEGEKEYLIKRGSFSGVNVINQNPDNRISFKDMVKRIKRITASRSGPVVK